MSETGLSEVIFDSVSEGVFIVDTHRKITSFNRSAEEITGVLREEAEAGTKNQCRVSVPD